MSTKVVEAPFIAYGALIHAWRNEIKFTPEMVAQDTKISVERLAQLEKGYEKPTWEELEKLAKNLL